MRASATKVSQKSKKTIIILTNINNARNNNQVANHMKSGEIHEQSPKHKPPSLRLLSASKSSSSSSPSPEVLGVKK